MNFSNIFSLGYWFDMYPGGWESFGGTLFTLLLTVVVAGIVCKILSSRVSQVVSQRLLARSGSLLLFTGLIGLFLWLIRQQQIPVFAARFWWLMIFIIVVWWLIVILNNIRKYKANIHEHAEKKEVFDKYLPKSKK
ncbi:MAG: hypothetical protein ACPGO5_03820 [Patescibacteria group bacterium]